MVSVVDKSPERARDLANGYLQALHVDKQWDGFDRELAAPALL